MKDKLQILVVDDEADFRQLMIFWLESKGYSIISAADGKKAVRLVKRENPDVVLLDIRMPIMDGVEVLKRIRKFNKDLPVILISAYVNDPRAREALAYGISGVFYKGKNFEEIMPMLETILRMHKELRKK
jgi:two-component system response regulator (stage 0 sporulation protein F)